MMLNGEWKISLSLADEVYLYDSSLLSVRVQDGILVMDSMSLGDKFPIGMQKRMVKYVRANDRVVAMSTLEDKQGMFARLGLVWNEQHKVYTKGM